MNDKHEIMKILFEKCDLIYYGQFISHELLLSNLTRFLDETSEEYSHNVGIILHTGSVLFDAIAVVYAALSDILLNETGGEDVVASLQPGDIVLYGVNKKERYRFEGIEIANDWRTNKPTRFAILKQPNKGDRSGSRVSEDFWSRIIPYQGKSEIYDGRGIRKRGTERRDFFCEVLGYEKNEIPSYIDTSTVIVMPRERASDIVSNIVFYFNGKMTKLLDLVTASYFTENDEYPFSGNIAKTEPTLKFCGNVSTARQKLTESSENKNIGLMVLGTDLVARGLTEIPVLLKRKALKYVFIALHIDSENGPFLLEQYDRSRLFACTKDFLLSNSLVEAGRGTLIDELNSQINAIINREIRPVVLRDELGWDDFVKFRRNILTIRRAEIDPELKDEFIPIAYSVMKVLVTAVFNIDVMERMVSLEAVNTDSPLKRINDLKEMLYRFPAYLKEAAESIVDILEFTYLYFSENSPKEKFLRDYLTENSKNKTAIIVPKAYYAKIMKEAGLYNLMYNPELLVITTANRFENNTVYDSIICLGDLSGRRFDPFRCRSSKKILTLLYSFESNLFKLKMKKANAIERVYNSQTSSSFTYDTEYENIVYDDDTDEAEVEEIAEEEIEIDDYIRKLNEQRISGWFGDSSGSGTMAVVTAVGIFETGQKIFFSQMYKAYVLDEGSGEVSEKSVDDLREGDTLIFTQNNEKTKDIIDDILQQLISDRKFPPDVMQSYYMSKRWKEALIDYKTANRLPVKEIANKMISSGVPVQEMTIRGWLDEDSHTVGPRKAESIQEIAYLVEDQDMLERYREYFDACSKIRTIRMRILKMLGQTIIRKVSGKKSENEGLFEAVAERISSLSLMLKLETLTIPEKGMQVPSNVTNRPFMLKE